MNDKKLLEYAMKASEMAYSPYSKMKVGAAIETRDGRIFSGCNIENASYSLTICAERTAALKAVSEGSKFFKKVAVYNNTKRLFYPCGSCLQVLSEWNDDIKFIISDASGRIIKESLTSLLPKTFKLKKGKTGRLK